MERLGTEVGNKEFSLWPFLNCHAFTFLSCSQKTKISEECNKDVKLASKGPNDFVPNCFMAPETAKICQVLQA
jgi:hypothetical protein